MEGAGTALVAQLKGMIGRLAEKGTWNGCVARECKVRHLDVKLSKWDAVASPMSDIRNAFGGGASGSVSGGASSGGGGGGGARGVKRERPPVSLDLTRDDAPADDDDDDDDDEVVEVEAPTVERLSKSASQRSDGDDYDDDAAGGGGGEPWYGHVRVYARGGDAGGRPLSSLLPPVACSTPLPTKASRTLVPIHPPSRRHRRHY